MDVETRGQHRPQHTPHTRRRDMRITSMTCKEINQMYDVREEAHSAITSLEWIRTVAKRVITDDPKTEGSLIREMQSEMVKLEERVKKLKTLLLQF